MNDSLMIRLASDDFDCEPVQVYRLTGREAISRCFRFEVDVAVPDTAELPAEEVIGSSVTIVFEQAGAVVRLVHGLVLAHEDRLETEATHRTYRLTIGPRAERLSLVTTQEVFVHASVPELIAQKLRQVGLEGEDARLSLVGSYGKRELVAQFKESDLAFVSRLAEHLGIFFFFEHEGGRDRIVFGDQNAACPPIDGDPTVPFRGRGDRRDVFEIVSRSRLMPAAWFTQDYNYRTPRVDLLARFDAPWGHVGGVVEYASHHKTPDEGEAIARMRAEERRVADSFFAGESAVCRLRAGATFTLAGHPRLGDRRFLVVEVEHHAEQHVLMHGETAKPPSYRNTFRVIDAEVPYRPPRVTPRPKIHGLLTGIVEPRPDAQLGTVADLDEEGRYTVRLLFDASPLDEREGSSHRMRMIQLHAGPDYGVHFPLKAGVEVLLAFMDGDPDRPLIVGAAPNPVTRSPVTAADSLMHRLKTSTGILIELKDHYG